MKIPPKIDADQGRFRQIVRGHVRKNLKRYISQGEMIGRVGGGRVRIPVRGSWGDGAVRVLAGAGLTDALPAAAGHEAALEGHVEPVAHGEAARRIAAHLPQDGAVGLWSSEPPRMGGECRRPRTEGPPTALAVERHAKRSAS